MRIFSAALVLALASPCRAGLSAAAGKADITPDLASERIFLAGFGATGKKPSAVHDPLFARALVLSDGEKTVAIVAVDVIGLFREDVLEIRRRLGWDGQKRYLFISATHTHSGPDTLGLWGPFPGVSGVNKRYRRRMISEIAGLVAGLAEKLEPAEISSAASVLDPRGLCRDGRDPVVIDPELNAVQVKSAGGKKRVIGTLVRWSCHPEVLWRENRLLTADYPGALCARVEERTGGACVFQAGVIGGLMTPDVDHSLGPEHDFHEVSRIGKRVADAALGSLSGARAEAGPRVSFLARTVRIPIENSRYLLFLRSLTFGHALFDAGGSPLPGWKTCWLPLRHLIFFPLPERLRPWVETEVSRVSIGSIAFLGIPGELFPELAIGGYDGRYRFGWPLFGPANPNPPAVALAPKGPYLRRKAGARAILVGLANDQLGYIVPDYDFQTTPNRSMEPHPPGTHYEETNSIGPAAAGILLKALEGLLSRQ